ncbi:hypothetical protein TKK_0018385 [Trichogramma kaykai]
MNFLRSFYLGHLERNVDIKNIQCYEPEAMSAESEVYTEKKLAEATNESHETQIEEYKVRVSTLLETSYNIINSDDWKIQKVTPEGDVISCMTLKYNGRKIYKITGKIDTPRDKLIDCLFDDIESCPTWNKTLKDVKKVLFIDRNTDVVHQTTSLLAKGAVAARDYLLLRHRGRYDPYYIATGTSVEFSGMPIQKDFVRAESGVTFYAAKHLDDDKSEFVWVLDTNLKGWLPQKLVDLSIHVCIKDFMTSLRKYANTL